MIDLRKYRVVDLSTELQPGILKVGGRYVHGRNVRRLEARQFIYAPDNMLMHWVDTETHIGTHVEGPSHYRDELRTVSQLPLEVFMGEAVVLRFKDLEPISGRGQPILASHLAT
ncbi:MAG: cyclase family protein, partial [Candidatus Bathyarchaeia archaeon]